MIIRQASIFDHTIVSIFIVRWLEEAAIKYPPINKAFCKWVTEILTDGYCLIAENDGIVVGISGSTFTHLPWNSEVWIMNNDWLYVVPEARKYGVARLLIKTTKEFAKEKGMLLITALMNGKDTARKDRLLEIADMTYLGGNFAYESGD